MKQKIKEIDNDNDYDDHDDTPMIRHVLIINSDAACKVETTTRKIFKSPKIFTN